MSVITQDVIVDNRSREQVLEWLAKPENHAVLLEGAFEKVQTKSAGDFEAVLVTPLKRRALSYRFLRADEEHGGRRVHVELSGSRIGGSLHYSLRTMKPTTNTLVTLHVDYDTGGLLGTLIDHSGLRRPYEDAWKKVLANLKQAIESTP